MTNAVRRGGSDVQLRLLDGCHENSVGKSASLFSSVSSSLFRQRAGSGCSPTGRLERTARRVYALRQSLAFPNFSRAMNNMWCVCSLCLCVAVGTYVTQVTATDADDPTYGNSARVVYSILHGQPYFSVDPKTGNSS